MAASLLWKAVHSTSGPKIVFPHFLSVKRVWHIYKKAIFYFPVSYFCFATSPNSILAELRLPTVTRKVKFTDFVKRATSPKMQLAELDFVFIQILRYIHYFDWRNMETFRKILSLPERPEDTLLWGLCSPTKIYPSLREKLSKVGSKWTLKSTSQ